MDTNERNRPVQGPEGTALQPVPAAYLEVIFGLETGRRHPVGQRSVVVGRGAEADFVLDDITVSRRHVEIQPRDGGFRLLDLGSGNGTRVNGEKVKDAALEDGTTIEVGSTIMVLKHGPLPSAAGADDPLREHDTQELPVLNVPGAASPRKRSRPAMQSETGRSPRRRAGLPDPRLAQLVSWLVVLALSIGGGLLVLNLLDFSANVRAPGNETQSLSQPRRVPARQVVDRQKVLAGAASEEPTSPSETVALDTPDVAMERYEQALAAETAGDFLSALEILQEIARKYPEYTPPDGPPIADRVATLERRAEYAATLRWARVLLPAQDPDPSRLQTLVAELSAVPTTDDAYGEEAMILAEQAKARLREADLAALSLGDAQKSAEGEIPGEPVEATQQGTAAADAEAAARMDEAVVAARNSAAAAYREGAFARAVETLQEAARTVEDVDAAKRLAYLAERVADFSRHFEQGTSLARLKNRAADSVEQLEKARLIDRELFGAYTQRLDRVLAGLYVEMAQRSLADAQFTVARRYLDKAREHDHTAREVSSLESTAALRVTALLRAAGKAANPESARALAEQALELSPPDSVQHEEAAALLEKLEN